MNQVRPFVPSDAKMLMQFEKNKLMEKINVSLKESSEKIVSGQSVYITCDGFSGLEISFIIQTYEATGEWAVTTDSDHDGRFFVFKPNVKA